MVSTIKKYTLESFSECTGVGNVVEVGRKSVPGGWATVGETSLVIAYLAGPRACCRVGGVLAGTVFARKRT